IETGVPEVRDLRQGSLVAGFDRIEDRVLALLRVCGAQSILGHDVCRHSRTVGSETEFGLPVGERLRVRRRRCFPVLADLGDVLDQWSDNGRGVEEYRAVGIVL